MAEGTEAGGSPRPRVFTVMAKLRSYSVTGTQDEPCSIHRERESVWGFGGKHKEREMVEETEADGRPSPLACTMMAKLQSYSVTGTQDEPCSIHRVPPNIREGDPGSYEPQIMSIGPYHHGNPKLHAMEEHKWRHLHNLLRRKHQIYSTQAVEECIEVVRGSEARARSYYSEPIGLDTDDFVKMMVVDGCFVLELFFRFRDGEQRDPLLKVGWVSTLVTRDILKFENQIPFFILQALFDVAVGRGITGWSLRPLTEHKIYHLLHFYDVILLPNKSPSTRPFCSFNVLSVLMKMTTSRKPKPTNKMSQTTIPCAVELGEAGIKLRRKPAETFLDVTFQNGTLGMPPVSIEDETNSVFRNLVALEQCCPNLGNHFTWYVTFLHCIVNTPQDVSILQNHGIVENMLGSEEEVAQLINLLGKEMTINGTNHKFAELYREVNQHCQFRWDKHGARCMRDYYSSPWSIISLVAAVFLLLMTAAVYFLRSAHVLYPMPTGYPTYTLVRVM